MIIGWILFALVLVAGALGWRRREWLVRRYLTDRGEVALPVGDVATARFVVREMDRTLHKSGAANEIIQHAPQLVRKLDRFAQVIGSCLSVDLLQRPSVTTDLILYFHATARANRTRIPLEASLNNGRLRTSGSFAS